MTDSCTFKELDIPEYEKVVIYENKNMHFKSIIAIHSTKRGPALGGCRVYPYQSTDDALQDVLRLSRGMTYKTAIANLNLGGGKAVILSNKQKTSPEIFEVFGECVDSLNGKYITSVDVGTDISNMAYIRKKTKHVVGLNHELGGVGDPGIYTAQGVFAAIQATVKKLRGTGILDDVSVAIQGVGKVGHHLCGYLNKNNVKLHISDKNKEAVKKVINKCGDKNIVVVDHNDIYDCKVDIFSPCAMGGILNNQIIPRLNCTAVVGAANNQLQDNEDGFSLHKRGILYVPDYVANVGGVMGVLPEIYGISSYLVQQKIKGIYDTVLCILNKAEKTSLSTHDIANQMAISNFI